MTTERVQVGKGRKASYQLITRQYTKQADGTFRESITLQTPPRADSVSDTQRLRLLTVRDLGKSYP